MNKCFMTLSSVALLLALAGCGSCCKKDQAVEAPVVETVQIDEQAFTTPTEEMGEAKEVIETSAE